MTVKNSPVPSFVTGTETRYDYESKMSVTFHTVTVRNLDGHGFRRFAAESQAAEYVRFLERQGAKRSKSVILPSFVALCEEFRALSEANPSYVYFVSRLFDGTVKSTAKTPEQCEDLETALAEFLEDSHEIADRRAFHMGQTVSRS